MIMFLVVEPTHAGSNLRFNISVTYLRLIILLIGDVSVDSETLLVIDFVNLKIKSTQSFKCTYRGRMYTRVFIGEYSYVYEYLCLCF
jgi:hypothetical protein